MNLDPGADVTVISENNFKKPNGSVFQMTKTKLAGRNNSQLDVKGKIKVQKGL